MDLMSLSKEELLSLKGQLEKDLSIGNDLYSLSKDQLLTLKSQLESDLQQQDLHDEEDNGSFISNLPRYAAQGARHLAAGVGDIPDLVFTPKNLYEMGKYEIKKRLADEGEDISPPDFSSFGLGEKVAHGIDELTGGYTAPKTEGERTFETVGRTIGSGVGTGGIGGTLVKGANALATTGKASKAAKILQKTGKGLQIGNLPTATNIGGHAGSAYITHKALEAEPDNYLKALVASTVGGIGGQKLGKATSSVLGGDIKNKTLRGTGKILGIKPENTEVFLENNITPTVGSVSDFKPIKHLENASSKLLLAGEPLEKIYKKRPKEFLEALGIEVGDNLTKEQISQKAKNALENIEKYSGEETERLKNQAYAHLKMPHNTKPKTLADMKSIRQDIIDISPTLKEMHKLRDSLETATEKKAFDKSALGSYIGRLSASTEGGKIKFKALDRIRKELGAKTKKSFGLIDDYDKGELKHLYGNLAEDINKHFEKLGGNALEDWKKYKDYVIDYKENEVPHINNLIKDSKKDTSEIFNSIYGNLEHGGKELKQVAKGLDINESKDLFDTLTFHLGKNKEGEFSPYTWGKKVNSLEPEVQKIYFDLADKSPSIQKKLPSLVEAALKTKELSNTSGTAIHNVLYGALLKAGRVLSGDITAALEPIAGWLGAWGLNKGLLGNKSFIEAVHKAQKLKNKGQIPVFLKSLEKIPEMPESVIKEARKIYKTARELNKIDSSISGVGIGGGIKRSIMTSILENSKGTHKKIIENDNNDKKWDKLYKLSPDKKYWIPRESTDEEYWRERQRGLPDHNWLSTKKG